NIDANEFAASALQRSLQIAQVAGVSELIHGDDPIARMVLQEILREVGADKARCAGDEQLHALAVACVFCAAAGRCVARARSRTSMLARHSDSKVPASVHQPSRMS